MIPLIVVASASAVSIWNSARDHQHADDEACRACSNVLNTALHGIAPRRRFARLGSHARDENRVVSIGNNGAVFLKLSMDSSDTRLSHQRRRFLSVSLFIETTSALTVVEGTSSKRVALNDDPP